MRPRRERLLRAAAALAAGAACAWEHLTADDDELVPQVEHPCPTCGGSLCSGPHMHLDDQGVRYVVWDTDDEHAALITDIDGGDPCLLYGGLQ